MLCPKCHSPMEAVVFNDVETGRCTRCKGIWFDVGERERLLKKKLARKLDTGEDDQGEHTNAIDRYACPRCGGGMVRIGEQQKNKYSVTDFFRNLATPARG